MAEYLLPNDTGLSVEDKRKVFSIRNRTIELSTNYPLKYRDELCICGEKEQMEHIYKCKLLNSETENIPYEKIFSNNLEEQTKVYNRFLQNYEKIERYKKNDDKFPHVIPNSDPLSS